MIVENLSLLPTYLYSAIIIQSTYLEPNPILDSNDLDFDHV